jgi:hypothetical protein
LAHIYESTGGPQWKRQRNWLSPNLHQWEGVVLDDGKVSRFNAEAVVHKLMPSDDGIICSTEDISIIVEPIEPHTKWKLKTYEL